MPEKFYTAGEVGQDIRCILRNCQEAYLGKIKYIKTPGGKSKGLQTAFF